ncbi:MAG: hypothetical protein IPP74_15700 [Alphaproteobacteria bacterium]|nr:hypothetical protein [Alphaproteobacteria bacterium]
MLNATVQSALVVIVAYLLDLGAKAVGLPLDSGVLASVAAGLVSYIISKFAGPPSAERMRSAFRK